MKTTDMDINNKREFFLGFCELTTLIVKSFIKSLCAKTNRQINKNQNNLLSYIVINKKKSSLERMLDLSKCT